MGAEVRRTEARKTALEVASDSESGENAAKGRRLEQHEDELERRVALRVIESGDVLNMRQTTGERDEEEQREDDRGNEKRWVREDVVQRSPRHTAGDSECSHVRAILTRNAQFDSASATTAITVATPKPSTSASVSHPTMIRLLTHSIR